jgi:hypothetical protein
VRRLFEVGALGTGIYLMLLTSIFMALMKRHATRTGTALMVFFLFSGLTAETTQISQSAGLFFLLTGLVVGLARRPAGIAPSAPVQSRHSTPMLSMANSR